MGLVTIHFEDHGQDFLRWTITTGGVVIDCQPCQGDIWEKAKILNRAELQVGVQPVYRFPGIERPLTLRYKIVAIHDAFDVKAEEAARAALPHQAKLLRPKVKLNRRSRR